MQLPEELYRNNSFAVLHCARMTLPIRVLWIAAKNDHSVVALCVPWSTAEVILRNPSCSRRRCSRRWSCGAATRGNHFHGRRSPILRWGATTAACSTDSGNILELDNATVSLQGFMIPLDTGAGHRRFLLAPTPPHCQFCMPAGPKRWSKCAPRRRFHSPWS